MHRAGHDPDNIQPDDILCDFCLRATWSLDIPSVEGHHGSIFCAECRGALGNSTTARQLMELGLAGGGGLGWAATGDPRYMAWGAAAGLARAGARIANAKVDERVMKKVAEMLISEDPAVIEKAIRQAAFSPQYLAAVEAISEAAGRLSRAAPPALATGASLE